MRMNVVLKTQGQEVEFHEIKIQLFQEVDTSIMRSKFLIMIRSPDHSIFHEIEIAFLGFWSHDRFVSYKYNHEVKIQKSIISNFDLKIAY